MSVNDDEIRALRAALGVTDGTLTDLRAVFWRRAAEEGIDLGGGGGGGGVTILEADEPIPEGAPANAVFFRKEA